MRTARFRFWAVSAAALAALLPSLKEARAWGQVGHELVAEFGAKLANPDALKNCGVSSDELILHANDPDKIWKQKRGKYKNEPMAHYFHVDAQKNDWRKHERTENMRDGFLVYRILDWAAEAKSLRKKNDFSELKEKLYGLSHYLADLTQPLHLYSDHDGRKAGMPGIHSQFETKMINKYRGEAREKVRNRAADGKLLREWSKVDFRQLVFDTAVRSATLAPKVFSLSQAALERPHGKNRSHFRPSYVKKILWKNTGELASEQLALGAKLWAGALNLICSNSP